MYTPPEPPAAPRRSPPSITILCSSTPVPLSTFNTTPSQHRRHLDHDMTPLHAQHSAARPGRICQSRDDSTSTYTSSGHPGVGYRASPLVSDNKHRGLQAHIHRHTPPATLQHLLSLQSHTHACHYAHPAAHHSAPRTRVTPAAGPPPAPSTTAGTPHRSARQTPRATLGSRRSSASAARRPPPPAPPPPPPAR